MPLPISDAVFGARTGQSLPTTRLPLQLPNSVPERCDSSGDWGVGLFRCRFRSASAGVYGVNILINWAIGLHKKHILSIIL